MWLADSWKDYEVLDTSAGEFQCNAVASRSKLTDHDDFFMLS